LRGEAGSDYFIGPVAMWKAILLLLWAVGSHAYFWDLEFGLHTSLRKGAALNAQTGAYLKDSWRTEVIVPTIADLKEKMKQMYRNNLTQDFCFGGSILVFGGMTILGLILGRKKVTKRVKQENEV
jgi:hypothetical protein